MCSGRTMPLPALLALMQRHLDTTARGNEAHMTQHNYTAEIRTVHQGVRVNPELPYLTLSREQGAAAGRAPAPADSGCCGGEGCSGARL